MRKLLSVLAVLFCFVGVAGCTSSVNDLQTSYNIVRPENSESSDVFESQSGYSEDYVSGRVTEDSIEYSSSIEMLPEDSKFGFNVTAVCDVASKCDPRSFASENGSFIIAYDLGLTLFSEMGSARIANLEKGDIVTVAGKGVANFYAGKYKMTKRIVLNDDFKGVDSLPKGFAFYTNNRYLFYADKIE